MSKLNQQRAACDELITTERAYVEILSTITTVFQQPLRRWAEESGRSKGAVNKTEVDAIFGSVDTLLKINQLLLEHLEAGKDKPAQLAETMHKFASAELRYYAPHVSKFPVVSALLNKLLKDRSLFKAAVRVLELQPAAKGLTLQALLVSTVQRLPRYTLLLREILKHSRTTKAAAAAAAAAARRPATVTERQRGAVARAAAPMRCLATATRAICSQALDASAVTVRGRPRRRTSGATSIPVLRGMLKRDDLVAPNRPRQGGGGDRPARARGRRRRRLRRRPARGQAQHVPLSDLLVLPHAGGGEATQRGTSRWAAAAASS